MVFFSFKDDEEEEDTLEDSGFVIDVFEVIGFDILATFDPLDTAVDFDTDDLDAFGFPAFPNPSFFFSPVGLFNFDVLLFSIFDVSATPLGNSFPRLFPAIIGIFFVEDKDPEERLVAFFFLATLTPFGSPVYRFSEPEFG